MCKLEHLTLNVFESLQFIASVSILLGFGIGNVLWTCHGFYKKKKLKVNDGNALNYLLFRSPNPKMPWAGPARKKTITTT